MNENLTSVALTYAEEFGTEGCGASGILISNDWIISHGSLLNERITRNMKLREFVENLKPGELKSMPEETRKDLKLRVYQEKSKNYEKFDKNNNRASNNASMKIYNSEIVEKEGSVIIAWKCPLLEKTFQNISNNWSFDKIRSNEKSLLSIFLIILMKKNTLEDSSSDEVFQARRVLTEFVENRDDLAIENPGRSCNVEISSTPFGNPVFIDSISRGVVSNVFGDDECLMLTDANAVPGSEGAPVYITRQDGTRNYICGMVIAPLSWCRGEWVDYTFVACLLPCLRRLLLSRSFDHQIVDIPDTRIADLLDKSLVLVRCGDGWGTGIIFDAETGTIITCSHVVHKAPESRIKVVLPWSVDSQSSGSSSSTWSRARLVYRTPKGEPYDIAVLRLYNPREIEPTLRSIKIANDGPVLRGEVVGSAGFPFFSSRFPTITRGNVSGISECMLRTTCCVQSGSSGGPIIRWSNGEMLGMVVCNAISTDKTKLYPRLNMAVPVSIIKPPIIEYLKTRNVKALDALATHDPNVRRTWNFYHLPSSKI